MSVFPSACRAPRCPAVVHEDYCEKHADQDSARTRFKEWEKRTDWEVSARARGYDARWDKTSKRYRKHHPLCEPCARQQRTVATALVDHIVPWQDGGAKYDRVNLESMCRSCHARKTARDKRTTGGGSEPTTSTGRTGGGSRKSYGGREKNG